MAKKKTAIRLAFERPIFELEARLEKLESVPDL